MMNYFELMNLPQQFEIDITVLQQTLHKLQSKFHPDNNPDNISEVTSTNQNQSQLDDTHPLNHESLAILSSLKSEQASAIINDAYNTLKNPDSRASHLLTLKGISQSINQPIRDLDFLDDAMSFRIELEEANSQTIQLLSQKLKQWLSLYEDRFGDVYQQLVSTDSNAAGYDSVIKQAADFIQKLQFLVKLQMDVAKTTDELAQQNFESDDDLYV